MLILYNEPLMINHLIGTSFVCSFLLNNKKSLLYLFEISLVDPLTLTTVFIIVQSSHQSFHLKVFFKSSSSSSSSSLLLLLLFIIYIVHLPVVRPRSCRIIYYFDTPALGIRHQLFDLVKVNQLFIFWMLLRIVLSLIVRIVPTLVKRFSIVDLILDCQSVMNLSPVETTLFKYMLSLVFLETIKSSRHASHNLQ